MGHHAEPEPVNDNYLDPIWDKEIELEQKVAKARKKAEKIIEDARNQAVKLIQTAKSEREKAYLAKKKEMEEARAANEKKLKGLGQSAGGVVEASLEGLGKQERAELKKIEQAANKNMKKVVDMILQQILP